MDEAMSGRRRASQGLTARPVVIVQDKGFDATALITDRCAPDSIGRATLSRPAVRLRRSSENFRVKFLRTFDSNFPVLGRGATDRRRVFFVGDEAGILRGHFRPGA